MHSTCPPLWFGECRGVPRCGEMPLHCRRPLRGAAERCCQCRCASRSESEDLSPGETFRGGKKMAARICVKGGERGSLIIFRSWKLTNTLLPLACAAATASRAAETPQPLWFGDSPQQAATRINGVSFMSRSGHLMENGSS